MGQSLTSVVTPVDQEKYYVFLICSQEKHLHFQEKARKGQEKISGQNMYEPFLYFRSESCLWDAYFKNLVMILFQ